MVFVPSVSLSAMEDFKAVGETLRCWGVKDRRLEAGESILDDETQKTFGAFRALTLSRSAMGFIMGLTKCIVQLVILSNPSSN